MSTTRDSRAVFQADVIVVGGGVIGLACATAVARRGLRTVVVSSSERGAASPASAGILAPSVGDTLPPVRALGVAARDMYRDYVESLTHRTGIRVPLDRSGVVEVAFTERDAATLRTSVRSGSEWLDETTLRDVEPRLGPAKGGAFHPQDGVIDVAALLAALTADVERDPHTSLIEGRVTQIRAETRPAVVELENAGRIEAEHVVVAAGAWVSVIRGLPRPLPVTPVRGQLLAFEGCFTRHTVMGSRGYVVQRGHRSLVGSTMEYVGFDARATDEGAALLRDVARKLSPSLADAPILDHWAGLRPVTPDLLPIVGRDPDCDRLVYACGHSKNGVLLAPLTGQVIADLVSRGSASIDIAPYAPDRFPAVGR